MALRGRGRKARAGRAGSVRSQQEMVPHAYLTAVGVARLSGARSTVVEDAVGPATIQERARKRDPSCVQHAEDTIPF